MASYTSYLNKCFCRGAEGFGVSRGPWGPFAWLEVPRPLGSTSFGNIATVHKSELWGHLARGSEAPQIRTCTQMRGSSTRNRAQSSNLSFGSSKLFAKSELSRSLGRSKTSRLHTNQKLETTLDRLRSNFEAIWLEITCSRPLRADLDATSEPLRGHFGDTWLGPFWNSSEAIWMPWLNLQIIGGDAWRDAWAQSVR